MLIEISEPSQAGEARRKALAFAQDLSFDDTRSGGVAIAASELATNIVKHAGKGAILVQTVGTNGQSCLRLLAVDGGPGIADMTKAMQDGHSTAGTLGSGLGAVRRLADEFEVYSTVGTGTIVRADFWREKRKSRPETALEIGVISEPIAGEEVCGDDWGIRMLPGGMLIMVADGLGHGTLANEAAQEANRVLAETRYFEPHKILDEVHGVLKKTRGAAVAVAKVDLDKKLLRFAGVGNVSASIVSPASSRGLASHNGTLGQNAARFQEFTYPWEANSILIMHSDGLGTRWNLQKYPGIWNRHPSIIAAVLHRDFSRGRDDVTVFVAKAA